MLSRQSRSDVGITRYGFFLVVILGFACTLVSRSDEPKPGKPAESKSAKKSAPKDDEILDVLSPPDLPAPEDGGPLAFVHSTEEAIRIFEERVSKNPKDFQSYRYLGELRARRAEETGDLEENAKAEVALRKSMELIPDHPRTLSSLAVVLCARHKFVEALGRAEEALKLDPRNIDALATVGDAQLELGRYADAEATYKKLLERGSFPPILARAARIAELKGDVEAAERLLVRALEGVLKTGTAKDAAWYYVQLGDLRLGEGQFDRAESYYKQVVEKCDPFHDATFGLGRAAAARGNLKEAETLFRKAVAIGPDPHMLATLGDLLIKTGRPAEAEPLFEQALKITAGKSEYLRERSTFLSDHDRDLPRALEAAEEDFRHRKDIHGYDALAWALFKNGRLAEARTAMDAALKIGLRDARIYYHDGMIRLGMGDKEGAERSLRKALAMNPAFSISQADQARKILDSL